jgi:hypothetical protein
MLPVGINVRQTGDRRYGFLSVQVLAPDMTWATLFERAADHRTTVDAVCTALDNHRVEGDGDA